MNRELNEAEASLLRKMKAHADAAAVDAGLEPSDPLSPEALDHLWLEWDWSDDPNVDGQKAATAFFGFAFGEYLVSQTGMKWRIVSDDQGEDYALVKPSTDVVAFPLATVSKRLAGPPFFVSLAATMVGDIRQAPGKSKPWWKLW